MTDRQERFCREYMVDMNAYQAALRAGYKEKTARDAYQWLKVNGNREKQDVRARVEELMQEQARKTEITVERIEAELAKIAFLDATNVIDPVTGMVRTDADADDRAAIAGMRVRTSGDANEYEVKLADKVKALELLGKRRGMWTDVVAVTGDVPKIVDDIT